MCVHIWNVHKYPIPMHIYSSFLHTLGLSTTSYAKRNTSIHIVAPCHCPAQQQDDDQKVCIAKNGRAPIARRSPIGEKTEPGDIGDTGDISMPTPEAYTDPIKLIQTYSSLVCKYNPYRTTMFCPIPKTHCSLLTQAHKPTIGHWQQGPIKPCPRKKNGGAQVSVKTESDDHHYIASMQRQGIQSFKICK